MRRLEELLLAWDEGSITAAEVAELKQLLARPELRSQAAREVFLTGVVLEALQTQKAAELEVGARPGEGGWERSAGEPQQVVRLWSGRMAVLTGVLAASIAVILGWYGLSQPGGVREEPQEPAVPLPVFAKVEKVQGGLFVVTDEKKLPLREGQVLAPGQGITTNSGDSEAVVDMDGIRFKMGGDTTVLTAIAERTAGEGETRLVLEKGEMLLEVTRALKQKKARVVTRLGSVVAEAEQTAIHLSEATGIVVIRGEASFYPKEKEKPLRLRAKEYVAFTAEGEPYLSEYFSGTGQVWTKFPGGGLVTNALGHCLAFSPEGKHLAAVNRNGEGNVRIGSVSGTGPVREVKGERAVAFSPDGRWLATAERISNVRSKVNLYAWPEPGSAPVRILSTKNSKGRVQCLAFSPDSRFLAVGRSSEKEPAELEIWEVASGTLRNCWREHLAMITCLAFSPEGELLASGSLDKAVILWDVATGREKARIVVNPNQAVWALAFAPDSPVLAIATGPADFRILQAGEVVLWNIEVDKVADRLVGHTRAVTSVLFSGDGQSLVTGSSDTTIRFWERKTGRQYGMFKGHQAAPGFEALAIALAPDGSSLATAGFDQTVRIWPTQGIRVAPAQDVFHFDFHRPEGWVAIVRRGGRL